MRNVITLTQAEWNMRATQVRISRLNKKSPKPATSTHPAKSAGPTVGSR